MGSSLGSVLSAVSTAGDKEEVPAFFPSHRPKLRREGTPSLWLTAAFPGAAAVPGTLWQLKKHLLVNE